MSSREIISSVEVGAGNPIAALARGCKLERDGINVGRVNISWSVILAALLHKLMTQHNALSAGYSENSNKVRDGKLMKLLAKFAYLEFKYKLDRLGYLEDDKPVWNVFQELPLLGADLKDVEKIFSLIRVFVPDVYPKQSAVSAIKRVGGLGQMMVWNDIALNHLHNHGVNATKINPWFISGILGEGALQNQNGPEIIVKSSGSGMPNKLFAQIWKFFDAVGASAAFYLPNFIINDDGSTQTPKNKNAGYEMFLRSLGKNTKFIIGYPSELVQIVAEMRQFGLETCLVALDPRGSHERLNLEYGKENGLICGSFQEFMDQFGLMI